ncbi:MAG: alginate export family protein [Mariprofundus sp.]|nr:alginate export family protein [Mariprofundus sp.]
MPKLITMLCLTACCALALLPYPLQAASHKDSVSLSSGIEWDAGGSLRLRYEWKQGFALGKPGAVDPQDYLLSQLRVHLNIHDSDRWGLFVEGQDSRVHSTFLRNTVNDTKAANIFADRFDLHQGYLDLGWGDDFGAKLRVGRQKFNLGALRLVASLEWVNTARVWDAVRLSQRLGKGRVVDVFASHLVAVRPRGFNTHAVTGNRMFDSQFYGVYLTDKLSVRDSRIELYYLLRRNTRAGDRVHTTGLRYDYKKGAWNADGEAMLQTGNYGFLRQRAYAAHIGIGRTLWPDWHLGIAYNYGSGDSNPLDGKHQTFDNLYPLNHAYYGYMDLFSLQNIHNGEAVLTWKANKQNKLRLAYEGFWLVKSGTDAWYNAGGGAIRRATGSVSSYVGSEIDFTLATAFKPWHISTVLGYSHFFAGSYIQQTGTSRDANFFFLQTKYIY